MTGPLRLYQERAIELLRNSLRTGHKRPILALPTGAGKTRIALEIISSALAKSKRVVFVVPRISLIQQTIAAFESVDSSLGVLQGQHFRTDAGAPLQIASAQTLIRRQKPDAELVIIDECHMRFKSVSKWMRGPRWVDVPFLGLTATPWAKGLGTDYDDLLKPTSITEMIEQGYLCPFRTFAPSEPDLSDVRTASTGDYREDDLSKACDTTSIVANVVQTWLDSGENRPTLCYGVDCAHAKHLQDRFLEAGIASEYIDAETPMFEREDTFARFRSGETRIICNVATLDTGIDLDVRCIIDARPTKSRIRYVQTVGRGLRTAGGKDHLIILDHAGNSQRLGLVSQIDFPKLCDGKASQRNIDKGKDEKPPRVRICPECRHVIPPPTPPACPACGARLFTPTEVIERDGTLLEFGKKQPPAQQLKLPIDEALWHGALTKIARERGYKNGWAAAQFRQKFGRWPLVRYSPEREPTVEIINFVRSRQIAFAKSKHKAENRNMYAALAKHRKQPKQPIDLASTDDDVRNAAWRAEALKLAGIAADSPVEVRVEANETPVGRKPTIEDTRLGLYRILGEDSQPVGRLPKLTALQSQRLSADPTVNVLYESDWKLAD